MCPRIKIEFFSFDSRNYKKFTEELYKFTMMKVKDNYT